MMRLLVTGATGKVGQAFLGRFLEEPKWVGASVVALCHNRTLPESDRLSVVRGSISEREVVAQAMDGVTHVVHMAAVKEDPVHAMDVSIKGMFHLLEEFRFNPTATQFMLIGGDCVVGHCVVKWDEPVTEMSGWRPYPGVYALSKVLEEAMLEQYFTQYGINGVTLRAPWIMEKDDFRYALSFGEDQFGGPPWESFITPAQRAEHAASNRVPLLLDADGKPLRRNFVHVDDLVEAMLAALDNPAAHQQLFNVAMTEPVDYGVVAEHLKATRGLEPVRIPSTLHSNILDNAKARHLLGWTPRVGTRELVDRAFAYQRAPDDVRKIWYVG
jgi:nucleoside-diphosphate-sugar epimerase